MVGLDFKDISELIRELTVAHISLERFFMDLKKQFKSDNKFNLAEVYYLLDIENKSFITLGDVILLLLIIS